MASTGKTIRFSPALTESMEERWKSLGYRSFSDYIKSLARYDCLVGGEDHAVTMPITQKGLAEQDCIDEQILQWVKQGKKGRGVLLEKMIDRAIANGATTAEDVKRNISDQLGS